MKLVGRMTFDALDGEVANSPVRMLAAPWPDAPEVVREQLAFPLGDALLPISLGVFGMSVAALERPPLRR